MDVSPFDVGAYDGPDWFCSLSHVAKWIKACVAGERCLEGGGGVENFPSRVPACVGREWSWFPHSKHIYYILLSGAAYCSHGSVSRSITVSIPRLFSFVPTSSVALLARKLYEIWIVSEARSVGPGNPSYSWFAYDSPLQAHIDVCPLLADGCVMCVIGCLNVAR